MQKIFLSLFVFVFLLACSPAEEPIKKIEIMRVGVLPDESIESLKLRHQSLIDYLAKQLNMPVELIIPEGYNELIDLIGNQKIDLGYFGGVTYVQAHEKYHISPIVMRDIDKDFSTYFIANQNATGNKLEDFKAMRLSYGNRLSTSGHFMPLYFLQERQINPVEFFSEIQYSGSHDASIYNVRDNKADLVAVNSKVVKAMIEDGRVSEKEIQLIWETPTYADYVWAIRNDLGDVFTEKVSHAFLSLSPLDPDHIKILNDQRAGGFLPAGKQDFDDLASVLKEGTIP